MYFILFCPLKSNVDFIKVHDRCSAKMSNNLLIQLTKTVYHSLLLKCQWQLHEGTPLGSLPFGSGLNFPIPFALSISSYCSQLCVISLISSPIYTIFCKPLFTSVLFSVTLCCGLSFDFVSACCPVLDNCFLG